MKNTKQIGTTGTNRKTKKNKQQKKKWEEPNNK